MGRTSFDGVLIVGAGLAGVAPLVGDGSNKLQPVPRPPCSRGARVEQGAEQVLNEGVWRHGSRGHDSRAALV